MDGSTYKDKTTFEHRLAESKKIKSKYPDRVPIIVEIYKNTLSFNKDYPQLDKNKYLVPVDLTMGQLLYVIRRRIKLGPEKAVFLQTSSGVMTPCSSLIGKIYNEYKDDDGFLYILLTFENFFG